MTQDEIIRMAREAGLLAEDEAWVSPHQEAIERFFNLAFASGAAHEREKQAEQEPDYFGLTHDHTWLSIDKKQYDKLKPEGRMTCYAAPVRTKDLTDDEIDAVVSQYDEDQTFEIARAVIAADREKNK